MRCATCVKRINEGDSSYTLTTHTHTHAHTHNILSKLLFLLSPMCQIVIAHRLSTVKNCDLITVMDKGCIIEGPLSHDELMKIDGGSYARWVETAKLTEHHVKA